MRSAPILFLTLSAAACANSDQPAAPDAAPTTFIAFDSTFQGFRTWTAFHDQGPAPGTVSVDVLGPRTQYINHVPQHKGSTFPVGTVIVEARESGQKLIFAAAKRGGGFNLNGAKDWEWFELTEAADGTVAIAWRGVGPPSGANHYGGTDRCNVCHTGCAANDYVCAPKMALGDF